MKITLESDEQAMTRVLDNIEDAETDLAYTKFVVRVLRIVSAVFAVGFVVAVLIAQEFDVPGASHTNGGVALCVVLACVSLLLCLLGAGYSTWLWLTTQQGDEETLVKARRAHRDLVATQGKSAPDDSE